jgi:hypothetical protein
MFAIAAAVSFGVALVLDITGTGRGSTSPQTFMLIGLLCLALAAIFPGWPRRP